MSEISVREQILNYTKKDYEIWKEKYEVPEYLEFQIMTLLELRWEFKLTSNDHTKRKMDLLKMIQDIEARLPRDIYKEKKSKYNKEIKIMNINHDRKFTFVTIKDCLQGTLREKSYNRYELNCSEVFDQIRDMVELYKIDFIHIVKDGYGIAAYDYFKQSNLADKVVAFSVIEFNK